MCCEQKDSGKVGDTLTATVKGAAAASYKWTINGKGAVTTETYTVPADANAGDAIKLVVTAEDGETAEDTVYVGGFTILKVEPTTASTSNSYKYIRAYFSTGLKSLTTEDVVIRAVKSQQLYTVESVKLSSDGTFADITIAGDASVATTKFLQAGMKYGCTVNYDGDAAYLEFELPIFYSDLTVTSVNVDDAKVTVYGSGRNNDSWNYYGEYEIGDIYEGNLGSLVGRHVNMNVNSDEQVTDFYVQDEAIVIGSMEAKNDDENKAVDKRYFKDLLTGKTYKFSANTTSSNNYTQIINGVDGDELAWAEGKYNYAKLVMNPNGTVASAVLVDPLNLVIVCTSNNDGKVTQDTERAADFSGYTIVKDDEYIEAKDIAEGDVIYYNTATKFADVFKTTVSGTIGNVYTTKVQLDETDYTWKGTYKTAQYYDEDAGKYKEVDQPYLIKLDTEEETTFVLDRRGEVKFVLGEETGITAYTDTDYVITDTTLAYWDKGHWYLQIPVSNGTADTLTVKLSDLNSWGGVSGSYTIVETNNNPGVATINFKDEDGKAPDTSWATPMTITDFNTQFANLKPADGVIDKTILTVTSETLSGKITGLKLEAAPKETAKATGVTPDTTFQNGDTKLETATEKYNLSSDTPVYIINKPDTGKTAYKVKKVTMADFNSATKAGMLNHVNFFVDKTSVTKVVVDNSKGDAIEDAEAAYELNGIVLSYKSGFNTEDQKTMELKSLKVLTTAGTFTYTDFANQIKAVAGKPLTEAAKDGDDDIDDAYVTIGFNSDDEILYVNKIENEAEKTYTAITASESATSLTIAGVDVAATDDAVIAVRTGEGNYTATTINEINTNNKYDADHKLVSYHKDTGDAAAVKADIIVVKYVDSPEVVTGPITIETNAGAGGIFTDADGKKLISTEATSLKATYNGDKEIASVQWYMNGIAGAGTTAKTTDLTNIADLGVKEAGKTVYVKFVAADGTEIKSDTLVFAAPIAATLTKIDTIASSNLSGSAVGMTGAAAAGKVYLSTDQVVGNANDIEIGTFTASATTATLTGATAVTGLVAGANYYTILVPNDDVAGYAPIIAGTTTAATAVAKTIALTTAGEATGYVTLNTATAGAAFTVTDQYGNTGCAIPADTTTGHFTYSDANSGGVTLNTVSFAVAADGKATINFTTTGGAIEAGDTLTFNKISSNLNKNVVLTMTSATTGTLTLT